MNGRKAKHLRNLAMASTVGKPDVAYEDYYQPVYRNMQADFLGPPNFVKVGMGKPRELTSGCTRKRYQTMKKVYVRGFK